MPSQIKQDSLAASISTVRRLDSCQLTRLVTQADLDCLIESEYAELWFPFLPARHRLAAPTWPLAIEVLLTTLGHEQVLRTCSHIYVHGIGGVLQCAAHNLMKEHLQVQCSPTAPCLHL